jgi:hypothetical protein
VVTLELVILVALIVGGIVGRLVFRKPWTIRARSESGHELSWHASGFRRSGRVRDEVAAEIARGNPDVRPTELLNA